MDRAIDKRLEYTKGLHQAAEDRRFVIIQTELPLWHPTIKFVCGIPEMISREHIHLTVSDPHSSYRGYQVQRGVPWDWVLKIHFFSRTRPAVAKVRALGITHCHGIAQLDADQLLHRPGQPTVIELFDKQHADP